MNDIFTGVACEKKIFDGSPKINQFVLCIFFFEFRENEINSN